jgi:hypothetical protein
MAYCSNSILGYFCWKTVVKGHIKTTFQVISFAGCLFAVLYDLNDLLVGGIQ